MPCGHACLGCKEEIQCLPCLNEDCAKNSKVGLTQNEDDYCNICFTAALKSEPCVQLSSCSHVYHHGCLLQFLKNKWLSPRIVFNFLKCSICKMKMQTKNYA